MDGLIKQTYATVKNKKRISKSNQTEAVCFINIQYSQQTSTKKDNKMKGGHVSCLENSTHN